MFFHVWISGNKICTLCASEISHSLFLLEVDIAFITNDSFSLIKWLCKTACFSKWIDTSCGTHVCVLSFQCLSVDRYWSLLSVVTLWNALTKLIISSLCSATVHTSLNDEIFIAGAHIDKFTVLSLHDLATDSVLRVVHLVEILGVGGVEVTLLELGIEAGLALPHLLHHLALDVALHALILTADARHAVGLVLSGAVLGVVGRHQLLVRFTIDALIGVVELFTLDGLLEVEVALRDVRLSDRPRNITDKLVRKLLKCAIE